MARTREFQAWLANSYADQDTFLEVAEDFQDIQEATHGWAANGLMYLLNASLDFMEDDEQYFELGTYGGRSLAGALRGNQHKAQVIDAFLNCPANIRPSWEEAMLQFDVRDRITLHETLAEEFDAPLPPIGVFFYDGNHDAGHTYEGLKRFEQNLADHAIIIVDDIRIKAGLEQTPFPGHTHWDYPVERDVYRWLKENEDKATLLLITPWTFQQAIISYERN